MEKKKATKSKLKLRYKILLVFIFLATSLLLWARFISTSGLVIKEYGVSSSDLPASFHGLKIVQLTDIHYGRIVGEKGLAHIVKEVNLLKPDIVVFTGDLVDKDTKLTSSIKNIVIKDLNAIKALYGKYAISGNHDFDFKEYKQIITDGGFIDLDNRYDLIYNSENGSIFIGGLPSSIKGSPDIGKVMSYYDDVKNTVLPKYKILIMHTPDTFDDAKQYDFNLVLAGHSHNGQVRLPFIGKLYTPKGALKYFDPYYKIGNTDFYISGGLGTSEYNFRFFNKPSFNFFRVLKK